MPKLVIFRGDAVENEIHLAGRTLRIGRDNANEIILDDKSVSRFHAEVRADGGTYSIVDLKSRNGVWLNGQQIKGKTALALGVPVTLGAYELALEDDVSSGEFGDESSLLNSHTMVSAASADQPTNRPSRSATQRWSTTSPAVSAQRSALFWSGLVLLTLLLCGMTYAVIRYRTRPVQTVAVVEPPPVVPQEAPPPTPPVVDPKKAQVDQHLVDARAQMDGGDYAGAVRDHLQPALDLDPENAQVLELKRLADEAVAAAAAAQVKAPRPAPKPEQPAELETPGIPRRANEPYAEYTARAQRIAVNLQEGRNSLEKQDFALAIARFQLVERDQKGYRGVDSLLTETVAKQHQAAEEAIENGQKNEQAAKLPDALKWYQRAQTIDPASANARDKVNVLTERLTKDGLEAFSTSEVLRKRADYAKAIQSYKQAAELLPRGHEKSREAQKWLEILKP